MKFEKKENSFITNITPEDVCTETLADMSGREEVGCSTAAGKEPSDVGCREKKPG